MSSHDQARSLREYNLVVVGGGAVGKTALSVQFIHSKFDPAWYPTVEGPYRKQCMIDDEAALFDILDPAGLEKYEAIQKSYMTSGQGFLLVYSITSRTSFDEIQTVYQQILQIRGQDAVPMILVANKCELEYERQVSWNEGHDLAKLFGCQFIETSAKLRINVEEAFGSCVREIRRREKLKKGRQDQDGQGGHCSGCIVL